jgi:hypothetical protein
MFRCYRSVSEAVLAAAVLLAGFSACTNVSAVDRRLSDGGDAGEIKKAEDAGPPRPSGRCAAAAQLSSDGGATRTRGGFDPLGYDSLKNDLVWKPTSARIEVSRFSYFEGSSVYSIARADLSEVQRAALDGLCAFETFETIPVGDSPGYAVRITDQDGSVREYSAVDGNVSLRQGVETIAMQTLVPFLETFSCVSSDTVAVLDGDGGTPPRLTLDKHCVHGVRFRESGTMVVGFTVSEEATYAARLTSCDFPVQLRFLRADKTTVAEGTPNCGVLSQRLPPGEYLLSFEKPSSGQAWASFRFEKQ